MWRLAEATSSLDVNSPYAYMLSCWHFQESCLVAVDEQTLVGFVTGYRPPASPEDLFLWQVAVDARYRRRGIARMLVEALVSACEPRFVEATVTTTNDASRALLRTWAERRGAPFHEQPFLGSELFPDDHESEHLVRIGPLPPDDPAT